MLGGIGDGDRLPVDGGEREGPGFRGEDPQATRAAGPANICREGGKDGHAPVTGEQAGMENQAGFVSRADVLVQLRQDAVHEELEVSPVGGVRLGMIGGEDGVPIHFEVFGFPFERGEEDGIDITDADGEAAGKFGAGGFHPGRGGGDDEIGPCFHGVLQALLGGFRCVHVRISQRGGLERRQRGAARWGRLAGKDGNRLAVPGFPCALPVGGVGVPVQFEAQLAEQAVEARLVRQRRGSGREPGADAALDFGDGELFAEEGIPAERQSPHRRQAPGVNLASGGKLGGAGGGYGQIQEPGVREVGQTWLLGPWDGAEFLQDPQWSGKRILRRELLGCTAQGGGVSSEGRIDRDINPPGGTGFGEAGGGVRLLGFHRRADSSADELTALGFFLG